MQSATVIIAAGGAGHRMGAAIPKQFLPLAGTPVLIHTIRAFLRVAAIREVVVVAPTAQLERTGSLLAEHGLAARCRVVAGGTLRQDSVRLGLAAVAADSVLVAVHDAARPLIKPEDITQCLAAAERHGAAIVAVPVTDTLKQVGEQGVIGQTVDRQRLWRAQTPQACRADLLRRAFAQAEQAGFVGTDEASLLEFCKIPVTVVAGSETNLKITSPDDLRIAEALLGQTQGEQPPMTATNLRIGHGFDAHCLVEGRPLVLGGVTIPHELGLLGHSDADVLTHALCDAILGAMGQGDIGRHFPDSDPRYKGISSILLLERVMELAGENGYRLVNADVTVVAQRPKLASHYPAMLANLCRACNVSPSAINLKATTTEKMGYTGREEGISVHAVAMLCHG
ncbi:MAG: 2-C-methyl-D-erythritol 4-phosphate cytidylyltransferase [Thermodesulfobacteriota bacterium]